MTPTLDDDEGPGNGDDARRYSENMDERERWWPAPGRGR